MPLLQNLIHFAIQRLPLPTTLMAMVKLSSKYVEMRDETLIRYFVRVYHKGDFEVILKYILIPK